MNASQRRIARRHILSVLPVKSQVVVPTGSIGSVVGVDNSQNVVVKLKNNSTKTYRQQQLKLAA